ncbi:MAG: sodium/proton-translocating pyrophosphatase, partial [Bryobacteraceae bacterium]
MHSLFTAALWLQSAETGLSGANYLHIVMAISVLSLAVAFLFARSVLATDTGTPEMRRISDAIRKGAEAFMKRQNTTIVSLAAALAVIIFLAYFFSGGADGWKLAAKMTISF